MLEIKQCEPWQTEVYRFSWFLPACLLIFDLKKQQQFVSSTTSKSAVPNAMGAFERSAVTPSSSLDMSMLVAEPLTTWMDGWRFSWLDFIPKPSIPLGFDSDQPPTFRVPVLLLSFPDLCLSRVAPCEASWLVWVELTGVCMLLPDQSKSPSSTYPISSNSPWKSFLM